MNFDFRKVKGEINNGVSETIPGQAMSVPEMVRRSQAGLSISGTRIPLYTGDDQIPDFERMDISELYDFREKNELVLREYAKAVKDREQKNYDEKIQKAAVAKHKRDQKLAEKELGGRQAASTKDEKGGSDE